MARKSMRTVSKSTAGAMRNALNMYRKSGPGSRSGYSRGANAAIRAGKTGMAAHKAGMQSAGGSS